MRAGTGLFATFVAAALSGCMGSTVPPSGALQDRAAQLPSPPVVASRESQRMKYYYGRVQQSLVAQGLLRTDGGGRDTPYTAAQLAETFKRIALYEEYTNLGGHIVAKATASKLHRWAEPIRMSLTFGGAIPPEQEAKDRQAVMSYASRLSRVTDHPVRMVGAGGNPNFHVFIVDEDARRELGPELRRIIPTIDKAAVNTVVNLPRSSYCLVIGYDPEDDGTYRTAVAVIRAEHPDLLRLSCIHEELAQGMGLSNDSPLARPSVFNDDEEFALLTRMDEELLAMLYDPRLKPGMDAEEAEPIVRQIAAERMGGET
ncbi:DUF2927 domain-containing protein [Ovoidimarina sediminis]|uniref:DUF2927 domain-containing protein n=1 Tax=Ovoidimarina sediminis TaxID=3079856 RepID=UPI002910A636|nr:DUF2927 domain-containing protein [Rhodophyticola sp. MJ-SS7]MDU8945172.1 DUF2927 domain-containing protein [Rhodophyticola sp. MJ-SS7]